MGTGSGKPLTVYFQPARLRPYRVRHWLPKWSGEVSLVMTRRVYRLLFRKSVGLYAHSSTRRGSYGDEPNRYPSLPPVITMKRRDKLVGSNLQLPSAAPVSVFLSKLPLIREWCSATAYEDGTTRTPGAFRMATRGSLWALTITDPDSAARITVVNQELDAALKLVESYLASPDAPWEPDPYATKNKPKKS